MTRGNKPTERPTSFQVVVGAFLKVCHKRVGLQRWQLGKFIRSPRDPLSVTARLRHTSPLYPLVCHAHQRPKLPQPGGRSSLDRYRTSCAPRLVHGLGQKRTTRETLLVVATRNGLINWVWTRLLTLDSDSVLTLSIAAAFFLRPSERSRSCRSLSWSTSRSVLVLFRRFTIALSRVEIFTARVSAHFRGVVVRGVVLQWRVVGKGQPTGRTTSGWWCGSMLRHATTGRGALGGSCSYSCNSQDIAIEMA